jgi:hypothetical protein
MRLLKRQRQLATLGRALILPRHRPTFGPRLNWTYSAFQIGLGLVILVTGIAFLSRIGLGRLPGDIMFQSTACAGAFGPWTGSSSARRSRARS